MDGLCGHQLVSVPKVYSASSRPLVYSFGGVNNFEEATNELYSLDLHDKSTTVAQVRSKGAPPSPRFRHAMCLVEKSRLASSSPGFGCVRGEEHWPNALQRLACVRPAERDLEPSQARQQHHTRAQSLSFGMLRLSTDGCAQVQTHCHRRHERVRVLRRPHDRVSAQQVDGKRKEHRFLSRGSKQVTQSEILFISM